MSGSLPVEDSGVQPDVGNTTALVANATDAPVESVTSVVTPLGHDTLGTSMETGANYTATTQPDTLAPRGMAGIPTGDQYTDAQNLPPESYYEPTRQRLSYDDTNVGRYGEPPQPDSARFQQLPENDGFRQNPIDQYYA